jgi:glucose/arabinose dehydrogenase
MTLPNRLVPALATLALAAPLFAGDTPLTSERVTSGLTRPIYATHAPGDDTRLYIIEKQGRIRVLNLKTGVVQALGSEFLNIDSLVGGGTTTNDERGLLGLAFHPEYQTNGLFYVYYTNNSSDTIVSRYEVTSPDSADASSASLVLFVDQPFSNHNGGWIGFGPNDGYLYIATGDGGSSCDPGQRAQDITNQLLGKMLRIDVDGGSPYAIPAANPFVGITGDDEIWSFGLRNPWRPSFDRATGDLYLADVGQFAWEEISFQSAASPGGENYGWDCTEGNACPVSGCAAGACGCADADLVSPFHVYSHSLGCSITGGYVYRGCAVPDLQGTYFFADYCSARIWSGRYDGTGFTDFMDRTVELDPGALSISNIASFGEDLRGEVYICDQSGGEVFRIIPADYTPLYADIDCNLEVGFSDLLQVLAKWGPCVGCAADVDGDDDTDFDDLLLVLANWGPII